MKESNLLELNDFLKVVQKATYTSSHIIGNAIKSILNPVK
jgi:hypothetical protein